MEVIEDNITANVSCYSPEEKEELLQEARNFVNFYRKEICQQIKNWITK